MKKYFVLLSFLILTACSKGPDQTPIEPQVEPEASVQTAAENLEPVRWLENTHYIVLDQQASETPIIQEFFSFWCPHCHSFEPIVAQIKAQISDNTTFEKVHVDFMSFTTPEIQQSATKAMLMAKHMGLDARITSAIFAHIHVKKLGITGMADIKPLFLANNVTAQEFDNALALPEVQSLIDEHNKVFVQYRANINSVPTFIVNGKYKATFQRDMNIDDIVDLIVWLTSK